MNKKLLICACIAISVSMHADYTQPTGYAYVGNEIVPMYGSDAKKDSRPGYTQVGDKKISKYRSDAERDQDAGYASIDNKRDMNGRNKK